MIPKIPFLVDEGRIAFILTFSASVIAVFSTFGYFHSMTLRIQAIRGELSEGMENFNTIQVIF
jgi:hypothetical protein